MKITTKGSVIALELIATLVIFLSFSKPVLSQELIAQSYLNQTVMGLQTGYGVRLLNHSGFGLGIIHQSNLRRSEFQGSGYSFSGFELLFPITNCSRVQLYFAPKLGLLEQRFFILIPEVETRVKLNRWISLSFSAGIRATQASTALKLSIHPIQ